MAIQFLQNMKKVKHFVIQWSKEKKEKDDKLLREVEEALASKLSWKDLVFYQTPRRLRSTN
jgi:hypothetical protein